MMISYQAWGTHRGMITIVPNAVYKASLARCTISLLFITFESTFTCNAFEKTNKQNGIYNKYISTHTNKEWKTCACVCASDWLQFV